MTTEKEEYEIAKKLLDLQHHGFKRNDSTDELINKNVLLFTEFNNRVYYHSQTSLNQDEDPPVQLAPISSNEDNKDVTLESIYNKISGSSAFKLHKRTNDQKKRHMSYEKPRWSNPMKNLLLMAIIEQKELADMTTFDWAKIGKQMGRSGKACKDQWRRSILPKLLKIYSDNNQSDNE